MSKNLYLGNLPWATEDDDLSKFLLNEGIQVRSIRVVVDRETGRSRGFAFVEVPQDTLEDVVENLNGKVFNGRPLMASKARPRFRPEEQEE